MESISLSKNLVNDAPYERLIAVGDLHGCFKKLMLLWNKISSTDDFVIFLGDFIDCGDGVSDVLKWVTAHKDNSNYIFLRGNHEQMMLNAFTYDHELMDKFLSGEKNQLLYRDAVKHEAATVWLINGGDKTLTALKKMKSEDSAVVDKVLNFIKRLPLYHKMTINGEEYIFVHAGVNPDKSLEEQGEKDLLWIRKKFFHKTEGYNGKEFIIVGHTPTLYLSRDNDGTIMMNLGGIPFEVGYMNPEEPFKTEALEAMLRIFTEQVDNLTKQVNELRREVKALYDLCK